MNQYDAIIVGTGLAGLVAACELIEQKKKILLVDQTSKENMGGQAFWSFGGLFLIDSPLQRRMGIKDSFELAHQDWMGTAAFDREEDYWPRKWAEAYLDFAAGEKYSWLRKRGIKFFPVVGWAERGGQLATGHGNSVPRFHVTWGTGPGLLAPFISQVMEGVNQNLVTLKFGHRVKAIDMQNGVATGISGEILELPPVARGKKSSEKIVGEFTFQGDHIIISSGGIGANIDLVKKNWPERLGNPPKNMLSGVPEYVDGKMLEIAVNTGAHWINKDRMWHYTEGIKNFDPIWKNHGIRILPGPSSIWLDAEGKQFPPPLFPGFDTLQTLRHICETGCDYSWFILNQKIIKKEFALSGSEQNPDLTNKQWKQVLGRAFGKNATPPVEAFKKFGEDFIVKNNLEDLVAAMNEKSDGPTISFDHVYQILQSRDREIKNPFTKDAQITALRGARKYLGDKLIRTAAPHQILDPAAGPLIAVKLHVLTRKTLGGLETNLAGQVLNQNREIIKGLYAAGEASGFGGGGMHGYSALEGSFLGGCIFSGRSAGRTVASLL